jgi:hypothetical protein
MTACFEVRFNSPEEEKALSVVAINKILRTIFVLPLSNIRIIGFYFLLTFKKVVNFGTAW